MSHVTGPDYLNVLRFLDIPQAVAMAAERSQVRVYAEDSKPWDYVAEVGKVLGWEEKQFQVRRSMEEESGDSREHAGKEKQP